MMILNMIMLFTMYPVLLIMYFFLKSAGDKGNQYCFGATLRRELREEKEVKEIVSAYKKQLKTALLILAIVPIPCFFIPYFSISMSIWMLWMLVVCFVPCLLYGMSNVKILELKRAMGWNEETEFSYADLKAAVVARKVSLKGFLPSIILSMIPVVLAAVMFKDEGTYVFVSLVAVFAACTILFYVSAVWCDKQKVSIICCDSDINTNYARAKKQTWKSLWMYSAWINTVFTWFVLFLMWQRNIATLGMVFGSVIYCIAIIVVCMVMLKKLRNIDKAYADKRTLTDAAEDDKNWIFGQFYYNKKDRHYMVESRMGTGTTVNLATKAGMITNIFGVLALVSIPVICIWMIMVEFTPIKVSVENETIICEQLKVEYEIPLSEIESYTIVEELPNMNKISGMGMDNVYIGTFEVWREGSFETFLNPQNELFIRLVMEDGEVYYISGIDDSTTAQLLDEIEMNVMK